ncbi:MAG: S8 family serine peptidase [Tepidisphaeraceae bacterium]
MTRVCHGFWKRLAAIGLGFLAGVAAGCSGHSNPSQTIPSGPDISLSDTSRDLGPPSKLAPSLQRLASASEVSRDLSPSDQGASLLPPPDEVGYPAPGTTDVFEVAIRITPDADVKAIAAAGATIQMRLGDTIYAAVHARDLNQLADVDGVKSVAPMPSGHIPKPPKSQLQTSPQEQVARDLGGGGGTGEAVKFEHQGLTGKGVVVGIVDTGIDWHHADFMNPDGTSRILYLWDIFDNTWDQSNHKVGSAPPVLADDTGKPLGTVYTNAQINAALKGQIKIPRSDSFGHGTACAGTAAGNGLGVAPQADLVIVNSYVDDAQNPDNDGSDAVQGAYWITQIASQLHEPCVISLSFGGHLSLHDGTGEEEHGFNQIVNGGELPGVAICASAGNEGQNVMHARGHFGPARVGELNGGFGEPVELFVKKQTILAALFDSRDDWNLRLIGLDKFLFGSDKKPARLDLSKSAQGETGGDGLQIFGSDNLAQADQAAVKSLRHDKKISLSPQPSGTDALFIELPPGQYLVLAAGISQKVSHGVYDLYLPEIYNGSFGAGGDHQMVVGDPGDADDVITVGSYDFRNQWDNADGGTTYCDQIEIGKISAYSNAGFRRDGAVKPDIVAPGQYTVSAMAVGSVMSKEGGSASITRDGKHLAWAGTSASCPYTAGVIALMLEKNPNLTENQIKQILRDTADHDLAVTGAVPNGEWGYGKLNPEAAIAKVSIAVVTPPGNIAPPGNTPPPAPGPAPVVPVPKDGFAGTFKCEGMTVVLVANADGTFSGSMVRNDQTFSLSAHIVAGQLEGSVSSQGKDFPFTATLDGDQLTLHAGDKSFVLTRQDAPRGVGEDWLQRSEPQSPGREEASRDLGGGGITLKPAVIEDPMVNNWPAYTLLVPEGWHFEGGVHWNQDPWTMVSPTILAHAPGGLPGLLVYPQGSYVAGIREARLQMVSGIEGAADLIAQQFAEGNIYMGHEIRIFAKPTDYIKRFVIPLYRKQLAHAQVVSIQDAPKFAKIYLNCASGTEGIQPSAEAVKVRFQYDLNGQGVDEDMYCAITSYPLPGGVVCWVANVVSFAAPRGSMDQSMPTLTTILASTKAQLKWVNACAQVRQMMIQNMSNAIAQEGQVSRYISQVSDQISDAGRQAYQEQQKIEDEVSKEWQDMMLGAP